MSSATIRSVIEARTTNAVTEAEDVLTDEIAPNTVNSAAERTSQDLAIFLNRRATTLQTLTERRQFQAELLTVGDIADEILAEIADELAVGDIRPRVLIVALDGNPRGDTADLPDRNYEAEQWFADSENLGSAITPYHLDDDFRGFSFSRAVTTTIGSRVGVIHVRYPVTVVQGVADVTAADDPVEIAVIDGGSGVLLAETGSGHDPLYINRRAIEAVGLDIDPALLDPADESLRSENSVVDDETIVSGRSLVPFGGVAGRPIG